MTTNEALFFGPMMIGLLLLWVSWMAWSARDSAIHPKQAETKPSAGGGVAPTPIHRAEQGDLQNAREQPRRTAA